MRGLRACGLPFTLAAVVATGCAAVPRPAVLSDVDAVDHGAAAEEARAYAPAALAHAEKLKGEANAAFSGHDVAGSQLLGERALAAYAHALALSRVAKADAGRDASDAKLAAAKLDMAGLDVEQARAGGEADALELKLHVMRDAEPVEASGRADPEREKARQAAARALVLQARLLCTGARMLSAAMGGAPASEKASPRLEPKLAAQVDEAFAALAAVDAQLGTTPGDKGARGPTGPTPIDAATRARAGCLAALTSLRRAATPVSRAPGVGDALLAEVSAVGHLLPSRDDRGVFVTLRGLFGAGGKASGLTAPGEAQLAEIGRIAASHPAFPVEVVVHGDRPLAPRDEPAQRARGEAVAKAIAATGRGVPVEVVVAGNHAPVVDPSGIDRERNARIEIVFVTPEAL